MTKYVISCPSCGNYAEATTGGFLGFGKTRRINCTCGYIINIQTDKVAEKICSKCGNGVIFDQSQGENALCPVCHEKIHTREELNNMTTVTCTSCNCIITTYKNALMENCPLCGMVVDVQAAIRREEAMTLNQPSLIKCELGNDVFVWKHPLENFHSGSQLVVREGQEAVFLRNGKAFQPFKAGGYTLDDSLISLVKDNNGVYQSEVYFINTATHFGIKWGTDSKVRFHEPASGLYIEIGACGNFNICVSDSMKLLQNVVGSTGALYDSELMDNNECGTDKILGKIRAIVMNKVKTTLVNAIKENNIDILEVDEHLDVLSEAIRNAINPALAEYGLFMPEFIITFVMLPDDDPNFKRLKTQHTERVLFGREEQLTIDKSNMAQERMKVEEANKSEMELIRQQNAAKLADAQIQTEAQQNIARTQAQLQNDIIAEQGKAELDRIRDERAAEAERRRAHDNADALRVQAQSEADAEKIRMQTELEMLRMKNEIEAERIKMQGIASAEAYKAQAMAEAEERTAKGITYRDETAREIGLAAMENGDGTIASVIATKGIASVTEDSLAAANSMLDDNLGTLKKNAYLWNCPDCGTKDITSRCCPECGRKRPSVVSAVVWNCTCGMKNITSKCCPDCGRKRPELENAAWSCIACGQTGITSKFCPECGAPKPETVQ